MMPGRPPRRRPAPGGKTRDSEASVRQKQLAAILVAVKARPGQTAYELSLQVPADPPVTGTLFPPSRQDHPVSTGQAVQLLGFLRRGGKVRAETGPSGTTWHPADPES